MQKVTRLRDIEAPCEEVFQTVITLEKRMQLSPLWGLSQLLEVSDEYPFPGSTYRLRVNPGIPFGLSRETLNGAQGALAGLAGFLAMKLGQNIEPTDTIDSQVADATGELSYAPVEQTYIVVEYQPPHIFKYQQEADCKTIVTWVFKRIPSGTRVIYEECFCDERVCNEDFIPAMHKVIKEWLTNLERYCELRDKPGRRFIRWFLDRYYLKLRPDQRRVVLLMLAMQAIGLATFVIAVVIWGLPQLLF